MPIDISWLALSLVRGIGRKTLNNLLETFATTDNILCAGRKDLMQVQGIGNKTAQAIIDIKLHDLVLDAEKWQEAGVEIIPHYADEYPKSLKSLDDAPLVLFAHGNYQPETWQNAVAIIGTRQPSKEAKKFAFDLAHNLAKSGRAIISGLALGIDSAGHYGALQANTAPTIAVLGGGVLNIYPSQHIALAESILEKGAILSENAPNATSSAPRLVTRNRIISGLSQDIVVVQSDIKGGAMHAVKSAERQGKRVYTLDWNFSGNQALLHNGATALNSQNPMLPSSE
ncbi:MAG: hypothetical protein Phog2KO_07550 [Phototrophicaceae bacterium]